MKILKLQELTDKELQNIFFVLMEYSSIIKQIDEKQAKEYEKLATKINISYQTRKYERSKNGEEESWS